MIFYEDIDNHKKQLNKKINKSIVDTRVNLKSGEMLLYRTHAEWRQGSAEQNISKDTGFFVLIFYAGLTNAKSSESIGEFISKKKKKK
tara:strand:- start:80 stop:343 length:264 start_codon:yes stop_codon:yes gene_type:complete